MNFISNNKLEFAQFNNLACFPELFHAVTTRSGGVSPEPFSSLNLCINTGDNEANVLKNYERLSQALAFDLKTVVSSHQVHGTKIALVNEIPARVKPFPLAHALNGYDGFITTASNITLLVRVADCVPVILFEPDRKALAVLHAGWKGTVGGIAAKAATLMVQYFRCNIKQIKAGIGPSIGPCCYEVRHDVADNFLQTIPYSRIILSENSGEIFSLDLQETNRLQLIETGLAPEHIELSWLCTACNSNLFFSHRGEKGKTGRFALVAGLRS